MVLSTNYATLEEEKGLDFFAMNIKKTLHIQLQKEVESIKNSTIRNLWTNPLE